MRAREVSGSTPGSPGLAGASSSPTTPYTSALGGGAVVRSRPIVRMHAPARPWYLRRTRPRALRTRASPPAWESAQWCVQLLPGGSNCRTIQDEGGQSTSFRGQGLLGGGGIWVIRNPAVWVTQIPPPPPCGERRIREDGWASGGVDAQLKPRVHRRSSGQTVQKLDATLIKRSRAPCRYATPALTQANSSLVPHVRAADRRRDLRRPVRQREDEDRSAPIR